jgi:hypothetical protein
MAGAAKGPAIKVTGARELQSALKNMAGHADDLKQVHQRLAAPLTALARTEAPIRSGALAGTVRASASKRALGLRAGNRGVPYAGPIHWGWPARGINPNPFLIRARDALAPQVAEAYLRQVNELIETLYRESITQ